MKNKKWVSYTVGIILTLIALTVVGVAGFRAGMMQNIPFARMGIEHNFGNNGPMMQGANPEANNNNIRPNDNGKDSFGGNPQFMQGNSRGHDFKNRGFERGRGGMSMIGGLFGLIHFAILALLLWFGYKLVRNSGWRFVRVQQPTASPTTEATNVEVEEKKV